MLSAWHTVTVVLRITETSEIEQKMYSIFELKYSIFHRIALQINNILVSKMFLKYFHIKSIFIIFWELKNGMI